MTKYTQFAFCIMYYVSIILKSIKTINVDYCYIGLNTRLKHNNVCIYLHLLLELKLLEDLF